MSMKRRIDFSNVKESSGINPKHLEEGDYSAKIVKVEETMKEGDNGKVPMWNFHFQLEDMKSAVYPYYCKLQENQLWKLRNLLVAAGKQVPKKSVSVDPESLVGKVVAITLEDDEYEGKMKSIIAAVFPVEELTATVDPDDDDDDLETEDEDLEEDGDDEEAGEEAGDKFDAMERTELAKAAKAAGIKVLKRHSDDDLRSMLREAEGEGDDEEEDDEELDLDDLDD